MLNFKPHTVTVQGATVSVTANNVIKAPAFAAGVSVECMVEPRDKGTTYTRYGVDLDNPWELYCEVADATLFAVGNRVSYDGKILVVSAPPKVYSMGLEADHAKILLDELQHA